MQRAARAAPSNAQILYMAARMQLDQGQRAEAEAGFQRVLRILPDHVAALNDLAWLLAEDGRELERAESLALRAVRHGRQAATLDTLGTVRRKLGHTEAARKAFEKALEEDPDYASARYHLGLVLAELGEAEQAKAALRQALTEPGFAEASQARTALARLEGGGTP